ncbi:MAG TPA: alpha/beta hydrolase [Candidatus Saccharimonadales bacterium]|nr:alpha/beta hydrolase [Candidatus Saccharimonadales bacterium]
MNVVVNGLMTSYQKSGSGKAIVFLHGWGDRSATFSGLIEILEAKYTVLALDLPGFGGTETPKTAWSLEDYAGFVADWLDKIKAPKLYGLVGHSFGGSVAVVGSAEGKLQPEKIVLLSSSGIRQDKSIRRRILWLGAKAGKLPLYILPADKAQNVKRKLYGKVGSDAMLLPHMVLTFRKFIKHDIRPEAGRITQPVLLIYGSKDSETPVGYGRLLNQSIRGSRLEVMPGAGHFVHHEQPDKVASLIDEFLKGKS